MPLEKLVQYSSSYSSKPCNEYSFKELAEIYNETRIDYIVPMPMNTRRMMEYVRDYDVHLGASFIALNERNEVSGIGMLGFRDERAWITRLGVIPHRRGRGLGQFLMDTMIDKAREYCAKMIQLEVIEGNEPAHQLFLKTGFKENRTLSVIRRPPGAKLPELFAGVNVQCIAPEDISLYLARRCETTSWVDENTSMMNGGLLEGMEITMPSGERAWGIFRSLPFQMSHLVTGDHSLEAITQLLIAIHMKYETKDTKIENLETGSSKWSAFERVGYLEDFRRIEMTLSL